MKGRTYLAGPVDALTGSCPNLLSPFDWDGHGHGWGGGSGGGYGYGNAGPQGGVDGGIVGYPSGGGIICADVLTITNADARRTERIFRCAGCVGGFECPIHGVRL